MVRQTASDRPGEAQPVPLRDIPEQPWGRIALIALALMLALTALWELYWRDFGASPGYRNDESQWAQQRRRINHGEGGATVLLGASRVLFDVQLPVWEKLTGERPIQLALEGTSPLPVLEDLARDPDFKGQLLIGVAPDVFFSGFAYRGSAIAYFRHEGPGQRVGHWLSQRLIEPWLAFYDSDFALATVVARQPWPARTGLRAGTEVRKLLEQEADRNSHMWSKLETDPAYRALARSIWHEDFGGPLPGMETPAAMQKAVDVQIARAVAALATLRARGVRALFVRPPSDGEYYEFERKYLPRAQTWDLLLARTGVPGIHFEDHPELQHYDLPEWSHMSAPEARRFTAALVPIVARTLTLPAPGLRQAAR
ncbi:MAG: hypothetical protein V4508_13770 [Pseudomonadota bacterium]